MARDDGRFDLHVVEQFFDLSACQCLIDEIRRAETSNALTYGKGNGGMVDERARKVRRATLNSPAAAGATARLLEYLPRLRDHFGFPLSDIEEPQFLWYGPGDFFVAHQDGNTGLIQLDSDRLRRVSLTIFLNAQSDDESPDCYSGGSLVFTDRATDDRCVMRGEIGKLVAFRSELTHEVAPVKSGNRFAIVTWCQIVA